MVRAASTRGAESSGVCVSNAEVADRLDEAADLLARQGANEFRIRAYRRGAATVRATVSEVAEIARAQGRSGLTRLPGIGDSLARAIEQLVTTGRMTALERLRSDDRPERLFATVADIGPKLAGRIHEALGVETLADLEAAAWDGRLARVPGMGRKRVRAVRESLAGRSAATSGVPARRSAAAIDDQPPVGELLDVDDEYRRRAARDQLLRVAPRRFNPEGRAWLPVLRTERNGRRYTAMFSNTARAHELGATHDWVVIYRTDESRGGPWTVVTARLGKFTGRRIVRGREEECAAWYADRG